ncbi:MAG: O-acetyl-ADP-ribose deacetylase [Candidatus Lactobacillus pullistercoris]|uniref:O-acetyl-ADP-ribose deacetylase n=1 Tax=Candidatus Lactobacillus pullistercoris TaxID=2838636 RepID=A0A9E2KT56_9LACO|nr:O-acetyl-ADP-ribose deacetylase [Candidatus Lactobacillus pullistercoris]
MAEIKIVQGDITKMKADAIVNAANKSLLGGGGVDGAIHAAAGPELLEECRALHGCETGEAKITKGYNLPAKYIIHTVGPIYRFHDQAENKRLLSNCYNNSLNLAKKYDLHSIIFSSISTGVYAYPAEQAAEVAFSTAKKWLLDHPDYEMEITMCAFDHQMYRIFTQELAKIN